MTAPAFTFTQRDDVVTLEEQIAGVRRAIRIRRQTYPGYKFGLLAKYKKSELDAWAAARKVGGAVA